MMTQPALPNAPHHHLSDELVFRYAAGQLDEAVSLVIASHLSLCVACRALAAEAELLGGVLLEEMPAATIDATLWQGTLTRLAYHPPAKAAKRRPPARGPLASLYPAPLRLYLPEKVDHLPWRRLAPGIRDLELVRSRSGSVARLLSVGAGHAIFDHSHGGLELTLTLHGSYISAGTRYARGDIEYADEDILHRPTAETGSDCLCLVVTDAPLRFKALLGRLMQPLIGI